MRACVFGDGGCHGTRLGADARTHFARPAVWIGAPSVILL